MKKSITIFTIIGILIVLSATVVADNANVGDSSGIITRQHPDKPGVWQVFTLPLTTKPEMKEYKFQNTANLKEWGWTEDKVVGLASVSPEQVVVLKEKKDGMLIASGWFEFYQPIKQLVLKTTKDTFSVEVITEKEDTDVGHIMIVWIVFLLAYFLFLITGFKRGNIKMLNVSFVTAFIVAFIVSLAAATAVATVAVVAVAATVAVLTSVANTIVTAVVIVATIAIIIFVAIIAIIAAIATAVAAENRDKKAMFIASFIYYSMSLLLFYAVSDLSHTIIPMIAVPVVSALTWLLVKYKN